MIQRRRPISILICVVMFLTLLPPLTASAATADTLYASVKSEYESVKYEDFFTLLKPRVSSTEQLNIQTQLIKELGTMPTSEQLTARTQQIYMDKLDMRRSFETVKANLDTIMPKVLKTSWLTTVEQNYAVNQLRNNKLQVLLALTYLDRYYSFEAGGVSAKDILLYSPEIVGAQPDPDAFTTLTGLGSMAYEDAKGSKTVATYYAKLSWITGIDDITEFLKKMMEGTNAGISAAEYLCRRNAVIEERGQTSLFAKMQSDGRLKSYLLPLLNLSSKSVYVISADYTTTVGLTSTYGGAEDEEFKTRIVKAADSQQSFLDFWKRVSTKSNALDLGDDIVVVDTMAKKGTQYQSTSQLWSAEYGDAADAGVREFMTPMGLYRTYMSASAEADISGSIVQFFMCRGLMDSGVNAYTHELTHIYDDKVWFNGYGLREGVSGEAYATGFFESENNTQKRDGGASSYSPIFNLNTAYALGDNRIQNQSPERFASAEDLGEYMQGLMDVIYTLDVIEAEEILKLGNTDKAILFNKVSLVDDASKAGRKLDKFENITEEEAAKLNTIDDLVDNNIVSGRLIPKGNATTQTISYNDYVVVPMFEGVYAGLQNDAGNTGEFLFRRYAHELLGEYGWEKGMVAYASNQYANDGEALNAILDDKYGGSLAAFKKDMLQRRADKLEELKPTATYKDAEAMRKAISVALQTDLASMKSGAGMLYIKEVQNVKADIFKEYLLMTEDFRESIYGSQKEEPGTGGNTGETPDPTPTPEPEPEPTPTPTPEPTPCRHSYTEKTVKPEAKKSAATCTAAAVYYKSCSVCGETSISDRDTFTSGKALGHRHGTYVTTKKAAIGASGKQTAACTICKTHKLTRTIPAAGTPALSATTYTYNGKVKNPRVVIKDSNGNSISSANYTITTPTGRKNIGKYTYKVIFKNNYSGTKKLTMTIKVPNLAAAKNISVNLNGGHDDFRVTWSKVAGATGYYVYYKKSTAKSCTYLGTVTGTSYKKSNMTDGAAYSFRIYPFVKINGKTYKDSSYKTSSNVYTLKKVSAPRVIRKSKNIIKVSWSNILGETGYQIARSTKKNKGYKVIKTVNSTKVKSINIKTNRKKNYYYKIRAYKTVGGKKIYGPWSSARKYKLR